MGDMLTIPRHQTRLPQRRRSEFVNPLGAHGEFWNPKKWNSMELINVVCWIWYVVGASSFFHSKQTPIFWGGIPMATHGFTPGWQCLCHESRPGQTEIQPRGVVWCIHPSIHACMHASIHPSMHTYIHTCCSFWSQAIRADISVDLQIYNITT